MTAELDKIPGYFPVSKDEAKQLIAPYLATDGYYIIRPTDGEALCTICVSKNQKLMNYRLHKDGVTGHYYIRDSKFPTISSLIKHYQKYPLNEQVSTLLLYPVEPEQEEYVALVPPQNEPAPVSVQKIRAVSMPSPSSPVRNTAATENNKRSTLGATGSGSRGGSAGIGGAGRGGSAGIGGAGRGGSSSGGGNAGAGGRGGTNEESSDNIGKLPGVHVDLSKNDVPLIMQAFINQEGAYLVRPSVSSNGQFTISLTCQGSILNFKINTDPNDRQFFITPKKKFPTIRELLEGHKTTPLRSKARPGAKVYLVTPISIESVRQLLLPPPWQEFYDENYKRPYYYNTQTGQSSWERPKPVAPPTPTTPTNQSSASVVNKSLTMGSSSRVSNRPLPSLPEKQRQQQESKLLPKRTSMDDEKGKVLPGLRKYSEPSPLPGKSPGPQAREIGRRSSKEEVEARQPTLPPKESPVNAPPSLNPPNRHAFSERQGMAPPPLPAKVPSPRPDRHANRPLSQNSAPPPLPAKNEIPPLPGKNDITFAPSLPQKNEAPPLPSKNEMSVPPLPFKGPSPPPSSKGDLPSLPPKNSPSPSHRSTPPLPPKDNGPSFAPTSNGPSVPFLPPKELPAATSSKPKRPVEYMDTVITKTPPSPGLPAKDVISNGPPVAPPPPPLPPAGVPAPPPPPPLVPPSLDTPTQSRHKTFSAGSTPPAKKPEAPPPSAADGRPFDASDLMRAKSLLKRKNEEEQQQQQLPKSAKGGLHDVFATAFDQKLTSIRSAMESDEDTDIEEVDDDDWDD